MAHYERGYRELIVPGSTVPGLMNSLKPEHPLLVLVKPVKTLSKDPFVGEHSFIQEGVQVIFQYRKA